MANESYVDVMQDTFAQMPGFVGSAVADSDSGMALATLGGGDGLNIELAAAANTDVVKAKRKAIAMLELNEGIEDILITLDTQYHLIRPVESSPEVFVYLAVDRKTANLAVARMTLRKVTSRF